MESHKHCRNRRSKNHGSSWLALTRRLRISNLPADESNEEDLQQHLSTPIPSSNHHEPPSLDNIPQDNPDTGVENEFSDSLKAFENSSSNMTKQTLLAVLTVYGACAFTSRQYDYLCLVLTIANSEFILPCISTVRTVKWPFFVNNVFPKSSVVPFQCKHRFVPPSDHPIHVSGNTDPLQNGVSDNPPNLVDSSSPHLPALSEHASAEYKRMC